MTGARRSLTVVDVQRERDHKVERERERVEERERESRWVRERESRKEAELRTTSLESSLAKMARLLLLREEGHEGESNLFSPLLTGPRWSSQSFLVFFFFKKKKIRVKYPSCPSFNKEKCPICHS